MVVARGLVIFSSYYTYHCMLSSQLKVGLFKFNLLAEIKQRNAGEWNNVVLGRVAGWFRGYSQESLTIHVGFHHDHEPRGFPVSTEINMSNLIEIDRIYKWYV